MFKFPPTLTGAIEVMYRGFMYEDQWNGYNKQANRAFLEQLLAQQQQQQQQRAETAGAAAAEATTTAIATEPLAAPNDSAVA